MKLAIHKAALIALTILLANCGSKGLPNTSSSSAAKPAEDFAFVGDLPPTPPPGVVYKNKCTFHLANGSTAWFTERYVASGSDCNGEIATVRSNNPNARIVSIGINFVRDSVPSSVDKNKCTYNLRGDNGATWFSERYIAWGLDCNDEELLTVLANNPKATVTAVTSNYVHDDVAYNSKWKCTFNMTGQAGNRWFVERYIESNNCASETATVRANNPKASVSAPSVNFVHDPY